VVITFENRYLCQDGTYRWISWNSYPLVEEGLIFAVARDVTDSKRMEEQLRASLQEKEQLLRELYHRTKNNMQVISSMLALQATFSDDQQVHKAFQEAQNRIRSMNLVHEKLYQSQNLSNVNLDEYVGDLVQLLAAAYQATPARIALRLDTERVSTLIDTAVPCGLILNELISNALEHAFPGGRAGEIRVGLHRTDQAEIILEVSDNGFDFRNSGTFGLRMVIAIAEYQLQGQVTFAAGEGVTWHVRFRDSLYRARV
jgi:two-component sensor histidine kinase